MSQVYTVRLGFALTQASEFKELFVVPTDGAYVYVVRNIVLTGIDATPRFARVVIGGAPEVDNIPIFAADNLVWSRSAEVDLRMPLKPGEILYLWASAAGAYCAVSGYRFQNV